jgi:predicted NBD/HSP70 family sugar kinase
MVSEHIDVSSIAHYTLPKSVWTEKDLGDKALATPATVRKINGAAALSVLWSEGPMTRADLARRLGLTKASVTSITAQLESNGLVQTGSSVESGRVGRPGTFVSIRPGGSYFVGIEIGVDRMNAVTMDLAGNIQHHLETHGQFSEKPQAFVLDALADLYSCALSKLSGHVGSVREVRVAVPGYVRASGDLIDAKILGWGKMPLGKILSDRLGVEVKVENDANASAFAEWYLNEELRNTSMFLMLLETGVGGACITGGELAIGSNGLAGEIGHARFMLASNPASSPPRQSSSLQNLIGKGVLLSQLRGKGVFCEDAAGIVKLLEQKNAAAAELVEAWGMTLGTAISFVSLAYDVDYIVLSGEMAALFDHIEATIVAELEAILPPGFPAPKLRKGKFIEEGGAVGAAALGHAFALKSV